MQKSIRDIATNLLLLLAKIKSNPDVPNEIDGETLQKISLLDIEDINDAIHLLHDSGYVEWRQYLDTERYIFGSVWITPAGRYEAERISGAALVEPQEVSLIKQSFPPAHGQPISLPASPVGSPFGFTDEDWEYIALQKSNSRVLNVVMGYQFRSGHYDSEMLVGNVKHMFEIAVNAYNGSVGAIPAELVFRPLAAGYGEHLFNEIARDIIASDIAVFDTSDLNPNVMIELGVALTWGVRVLPIKSHECPDPPSDISGQTWAKYEENALHFLDVGHHDKLVRMVERAVRKKG